MGVMRKVLLAASESRWLRQQAPRMGFVKQAVRRFMPGERVEDALEAASALREQGITAVLTTMYPLRSATASEAFMTRFMITCRSCVASPSTGGRPGASWNCSTALLLIEACRRLLLSATTELRSSKRTTKRPLPE